MHKVLRVEESNHMLGLFCYFVCKQDEAKQGEVQAT